MEKQANSLHQLINGNEQALIKQVRIIDEFFKMDKASEMIESLNTLTEDLLFSNDLDNVTHNMRTHIVNQLRVVTLLAKLRECRIRV
ncbi:hypothetical protein [Dyadobacter aurulentus]|uniref:hypothetical protein n=1 Tax=Dyadobacter sp. UC 10 TaxID=2605428 RepID=UPI0011F19FBE|nr:hypothetical protein [Dyadobacter sp. UC 10]KAA0990068.1 hypothetical protein FXO21_07800 [Dyadobacter sp. UC 10]